jgi:hypothetical protein
MLVLLDPGEERTAPHQLAPTQGYGRDGGTIADPARDGFADMCLGAVKQRRDVRHREEIEILQ